MPRLSSFPDIVHACNLKNEPADGLFVQRKDSHSDLTEICVEKQVAQLPSAVLFQLAHGISIQLPSLTFKLLHFKTLKALMVQVILDSSSDEEEDGHLFVDWKKPLNTMEHSAAPNLVCLDSDSGGSPVRAVKHSSPRDLGQDVEPSALEMSSAINEPQRKSAQSKKTRLEDKEAEKLQRMEERAIRKQQKEGQKRQQQEEKRKKREAEKLHRAEVKEKAAQARKLDQERDKWEKGKFALQSTFAMIDCKVVENGLIGGPLLNRLAEKDFKYRLCSNPIAQSIVWKMKRPSQLSGSQSSEVELQLEEIDVPYVLLVFEAEEFSSILSRGFLDAHVRQVQSQYPGFTVCYLINKLNWYLQKKDQEQYKRGETSWVRPNADKALAELVTNYCGVHSRLCLDEAEVADHIVALTRSLAECPFKQKLTSLSVSKNGDHIVVNDPNKETIKMSIWLKALVAIPKVSGAAAVAISRKYTSFRSLLNAYMDPGMTVHEKELLLQDLVKEVGGSSRRVGPACSRRIYRILMAQNGDLKTEDVEVGADQFEED